MALRVLLAGGGTVGHVAPMLATAEALSALVANVEVTCLGTPQGLETTMVPPTGLTLELVPAVPLPRRATPDLLRLPGRVRTAVRAALEVLDRVRPDVVVGFGGYVSVPAYLAARRRRIPLVVHEGNALPGLANRLGARLTCHVATSFPGSSLPHATLTGLPLRRLVAEADRAALRAPGRAGFGLAADRPTLLVTGGSQGAARLNTAVAGAAQSLAARGVQVLHIAGRNNEVRVTGLPGGPRYVVVPFVPRIDLAYAAADLVICRAGASTVSEVAALGLPAVFVPLPIGNGEQALNAAPVVAAGGALLVDDAALSPQWVAATVPDLLHDGDRLRAMSRAAEGRLPRDAAASLATMALAAAGVAA